MRIFAWLTLFFCTIGCSMAQNGWESRFYRAFVVPHNVAMTDMMSGVSGFELGRYWRVDSGGRIDLRQYHPIVGVAAHCFNLGNQINGYSAGINAFYEAGVPLFHKLSLRARLAVGSGYLTQQFNIFSNPRNRAIGSHVNGFMQVTGYVEAPLSHRMDMQVGLGMSHYSNGNWSMPNLGINLPGLVFGLKYKDKDPGYIPIKYNRGKRVLWEFGSRVGKRQMSIDDPRNIAVYMVEFSGNYPHNDIRGWRGGINMFFDRTYLFEKFQPLPKVKHAGTITELAITLGHEYRVNRVGFVTDMGIYLYRPSDVKRKYYEAIGLKWYITDHLILMNRLKAHLTSADYFEWGMSYVFSGRNQTRPGFGNAFRWLFSGMKPVRLHDDAF